MSAGDVTLRAFRWEDLPAVLAQANVGAQHPTTLSRLRHYYANPARFPERDAVLAIDDGHRVVGDAIFTLEANNTQAIVFLRVHPDHRMLGPDAVRSVGGQLLAALEDRVRAVVPDGPVKLYAVVSDHDAWRRGLFSALGYQPVRPVFEMTRDLRQLETLPPLPPLPEGIALRPFDPDQHARAVHAADLNSFRDNWAFGDEPWARWRHELLGDDRFDPDLWLVAWAGDEIAAFCLCWPDEDDPELGIVEILGVLPDFRQRGLGRALLLRAFALFAQRGWHSSRLTVDGENAPAVALYKACGMHISTRQDVFYKPAR